MSRINFFYALAYIVALIAAIPVLEILGTHGLGILADQHSIITQKCRSHRSR